MEKWRENATEGLFWVLVVGIGLLGLGAGLNIAFDVGAHSGSVLALILMWAVGAVALSGAAILVLWVLARIVDAGRTRIKDPKQSYVPFVGAVVGVMSGLIASVLADDGVLAVTLGLLVAVVATAAAALIQSHPVLGMLLYAVPVLTLGIVVVLTMSPAEFERWLDDRSTRDAALIAASIAMFVGVPASVAWIETLRRRRS